MIRGHSDNDENHLTVEELLKLLGEVRLRRTLLKIGRAFSRLLAQLLGRVEEEKVEEEEEEEKKEFEWLKEVVTYAENSQFGQSSSSTTKHELESCIQKQMEEINQALVTRHKYVLSMRCVAIFHQHLFTMLRYRLVCSSLSKQFDHSLPEICLNLNK